MMDRHLELATDAYRMGLAETCRLVQEANAPYGSPLHTTAAILGVDAVASLLRDSFRLGARIDAGRLAWVIRRLDPSTYASVACNHSVNYLTSLLAKLFGPPEEAVEGEGGGDLAHDFAEWLQSIFLQAGYTGDAIESAWLNVLDMMVALMRDAVRRFGPEAIPVAAHHLRRILQLCPPRVSSELLDEELDRALSELGVSFSEMLPLSWQTGDGPPIELVAGRVQFERTRFEDVVAALAGGEPVSHGPLGIRNICIFSSPTSLVVKICTVPLEYSGSDPLTDGLVQAQLWVHYFLMPDPVCREAAWARGRAVLVSAHQSQEEVWHDEAGDALSRWESLLPQLQADDDEIWRPAAQEAVFTLYRSPIAVGSSLVDALHVPGLFVNLLSWVTPATVEAWLGIPPGEVSVTASLSTPPEVPVSSLLQGDDLTLFRALSSPFGDGEAQVRRLTGELDGVAAAEDERVYLKRFLELALKTSSATVASNILSAVLESARGVALADSDTELQTMLVGGLTRALWPMAAHTLPGQKGSANLALEYSLAAHLWINWTQHGEVGEDFEGRAYLAIAGAALLAALTSEGCMSPAAPPADGHLTEGLALDAANIAMAWHTEPDGHDFLVHPLRGQLCPWSALALIGPLTRHQDWLIRNEACATAVGALQFLGLITLMNVGLSCTRQTRRTALDQRLPENPVGEISQLLAARDPEREGEAAANAGTLDEEGDPADVLLPQIESGELRTAAFLLSNGVTFGPIGFAAWVGSMKRVAESEHLLGRILGNHDLRGEWLLTLSLSTVVAGALGREVPPVLWDALMSPSEGDSTEPSLRLTAITTAAASGAELAGIFASLFELLLMAAEDREAAKMCLLSVVGAARSRSATGRMKEELHDLLVRIAIVPPYDEMPELRRYRQTPPLR